MIKTCLELTECHHYGSHVVNGAVRKIRTVYIPLEAVGLLYDMVWLCDERDGEVREIHTCEVAWGTLGSSGSVHVLETAEEVARKIDEMRAALRGAGVPSPAPEPNQGTAPEQPDAELLLKFANLLGVHPKTVVMDGRSAAHWLPNGLCLRLTPDERLILTDADGTVSLERAVSTQKDITYVREAMLEALDMISRVRQ